jgi:hypothetical protein
MDDAPDIYTNSIRVAASLYEVSLEFRLQTPGEEGVHEEVVARIRMSPPQAMALRLLLDRHLRAYGEQYKEIFLPEEMIERLSGIEQVGETDDCQ